MRSLTPPRLDAPAVSPEAAARPAASRDDAPGYSGTWRREAALALATALAATAILVPVLQLWRAAWDVPFRYQGDATYHLSVAKGLIDFGGSSTNPALGAPFSQVIHDMPLGADRLHLALLRVLGAVTGDPAVTVNLFFVLSFPLVAVAALLVLRRLRVSAAPAVAGALLFAFLPYHFFRGENHLFLSGYYTVPVAVYLALRLLDGRAAGTHPPGRTALVVLGCVLVGSGGAYYAPFGALVVAIATVAAYARDRSLPLLRAGALAVGLILATFALNLAPSLWYVHQHGANHAGAVGRHPAESEFYGLKLTSLLLPRDDHRLPGLAGLSANFRHRSPVPSEPGQALGLVTAAGFCYLLGLAALTLAGRRRAPDADRHLSLLAVSTLVVGTVGGVSALIALLVSPQIRAWNRLSIYIAFLSVVALGGLADRFRAYRRARGLRPVTWGAVIGIVLAVGLLDQTSGADVPRYRLLAAQYRSDGAFVGAVEAALPDQAMVFQLPVRPFPELRGPAGMKVSDPFRLYLQSRHLRWSFGGVEGRPTADWQTPLAAQPAGSLLPRLAALGFSGLTVDRFGYDDRAAALEAELQAELGAAPAEISTDGRFSFFDLRRYAARQADAIGAEATKRLADQTVNPTRVTWTGVAGIGADPLDRVGTAPRQFTVSFANPDVNPRRIRFRLSIEGSPTSPPLRVELPGDSFEVPLTNGRAVVDRVLDIPTGRSEAVFTTGGFPISEVAATPAERYHLRLTDPAVYDLIGAAP